MSYFHLSISDIKKRLELNKQLDLRTSLTLDNDVIMQLNSWDEEFTKRHFAKEGLSSLWSTRGRAIDITSFSDREQGVLFSPEDMGKSSL